MTNKYIIIIGSSTFSDELATKFSLEGNSVVIIDKDRNLLDKISMEYSGFKICEDATDISILKEAQLEKADLLVVATRDDNKNIMISQIAYKILGVKKIMAKLYKLEKESMYDDLEVDLIKPLELEIRNFENILINKEI